MSLFNPPDCTIVGNDALISSDAGVAGIGTLLSFHIAALVSFLLSLWIILQEELRGRPFPRVRKLLKNYSDQHILQGIGISAVGLARFNSIVPYHFLIAWTLSSMSMAVHNASLLALVSQFHHDRVLRWLRQSLMMVNLALNFTYGVIILRSVSKGIQDSSLPVACAFRIENQVAGVNIGVGVGVGCGIVSNLIVFILAMRSFSLDRRREKKLRAIRWIKFVGMLAIAATAGTTAWRCFTTADAFGNGPVYDLGDQGERIWSFGQIQSMLVLFFPLVSLVGITRGERNAPPGDSPDGREYNRSDRESLQTKSFLGSRSNSIRRFREHLR